MPAVNQVAGTLPHAFREKFATTYAIIDGSKVFMDTIRLANAIFNLEPVQAS